MRVMCWHNQEGNRMTSYEFSTYIEGKERDEDESLRKRKKKDACFFEQGRSEREEREKGRSFFLNEVVQRDGGTIDADLSAREKGIELGNFPKVRSIVAATARC